MPGLFCSHRWVIHLNDDGHTFYWCYRCNRKALNPMLGVRLGWHLAPYSVNRWVP